MDENTFCRKYLDLIQGPYKGINLTRITDVEEFRIKQYQDSVIPFRNFKFDSIGAKIFDIGFGGGFPVLPLANEFPEVSFMGIETRNKKVKVVGEISEALGLKNTKFIHGRFEEFLYPAGSIVVNKAVATVKKVLDNISVEKDVTICFYKGPNFFTLEGKELETIEDNWSIMGKEEYSLSNGDPRVFFIVKSKNVLRRTNQKNLTKLIG